MNEIPTRNLKKNQHISLEEMKVALDKSGYSMELRIGSILDKSGFYLETNPVCYDTETRKTLEGDIYAIYTIDISLRRDEFLWVELFVECENNDQPVVLFSQPDLASNMMTAYDVKIKGMPIRVWRNRE